MYLFEKKPEKVSVAKIVLITTSIVLGVLAVLAVIYKLGKKYCPICGCDEDFDFGDELDCCDCTDDECAECDCDCTDTAEAAE